MDWPQLDHPRALWEQVYDVLEERILTHQIPPGSRLVETEVAATLGISRNPIREAIRALEQAGWVERPDHHTGVWVPRTGGADGVAVFEARRILEAETAALAAHRRREHDLEALRTTLAAGWAALDAGETAEVARLNASFHARIAAATGNAVLAGIQDRLDKRGRWHFTSIATVRGTASWTEHEEILSALADSDEDRARRLSQRHVERSHDALTKEQERRQNGDAPSAIGRLRP